MFQEGVLEVPHVARPGVLLQEQKGFWSDFRQRASQAAGMLLEEVPGQGDHVSGPFTERRNPDLQGREPVVQVLAQPSLLQRVLEGNAARSKEPHVRPPILDASQAPEGPGVEQVEELGL